MALSGPTFSSEEKQKFMQIMKTRDALAKKQALTSLSADELSRFKLWCVEYKRMVELEKEKRSLVSDVVDLTAQRATVLNQFSASAASQLGTITVGSSSDEAKSNTNKYRY